MASVYQKCGVWYVGYKDGTGKRRLTATKAKTRTAAKECAVELEGQGWRQRKGLEVLPAESKLSLGELVTWWLENRSPKASLKWNSERLTLHVLKTPLANVPARQVTAAVLEERLRRMEKAGSGPAFVNHVRANLRTVFNKARKAGLWSGPNPAADTEPRKVPKRVYEVLTAEQAALVLAHVPDVWRGFHAAGIYQALRKGECAGLLKSDVDLEMGLLTVRASYDHDSTKGQHADVIPVAPPMTQYLVRAMDTPGLYLFGDADGKMRNSESDPEKVLRRAMARAGLVQGYDHTCRRKSCRTSTGPHVERHPDPALRLCPKCQMKLWPKAIWRKMRFHDMRHSCATILLRAGVDPHRVQRILRHASVVTTTGTYGHLLAEDLREAMGSLGDAGPEATVAEADSAPFATRLLPQAGEAIPVPKIAPPTTGNSAAFSHESRGNRTHDPRLKRPVLYQLS